MAVFAISDLHLPGGDCKPMDVFGAQWAGHFERVCADWRARVRPDDVVMLPGDLSWAMRIEDALPDLRALGRLPGRKVILRGNHDYWWSSLSRLREALPEDMWAVQNDCAVFDDLIVTGSRGWVLPGEGASAEDEKIYRRELIRLEMALKAAAKRAEERPIYAMTHFPPLTEAMPDTEVTRLFELYGVRHVVYGHLHGQALRGAFRGTRGGVAYFPVSCDGLDFSLLQLP